MRDRSKGKDKKCNLWSSRLGVEREAYGSSPRKFTVTKPPEEKYGGADQQWAVAPEDKYRGADQHWAVAPEEKYGGADQHWAVAPEEKYGGADQHWALAPVKEKELTAVTYS
jgi:hypothetical protein